MAEPSVIADGVMNNNPIISKMEAYKKNVAIFALHREQLIAKLVFDKQFLEQSKQCDLIREDEYGNYEQHFDSFIGYNFVDLILSKMIAYYKALSDPNLILIDPFKLFIDVCILTIILFL